MSDFAISKVGPVIGYLDQHKIYEWVQDHAGHVYCFIGLFEEDCTYGPQDLTNGDLIFYPNIHYRRVEQKGE